MAFPFARKPPEIPNAAVEPRRPARSNISWKAPFWTLTIGELCGQLGCRSSGLTNAEALARLATYGPNADAAARQPGLVRAIVRRLLEPLSLILLVAGTVSAATGDTTGGAIIVAILGLSIGLDTFQEGQASRAAAALRASVALKAEVLRDGTFVRVAVEDVVPGDVIRVRAGDIVPADALVLECAAFTANEAALTGEPYPVEKTPKRSTGLTPSQASNALFRGAVAQTGEALGLVAGTGRMTLFGAAASALNQPTEVSPFERDLRAFGLLTARLTIALVLVVLATHVLFGRPVLQSLLFAVALAVGLTPELLPMITTVTLSRGAVRMAARKVIVKRLASIHDLGAMTVLCTDKTGTLTSAEIALARSFSLSGEDDPRPADLGAIAAILGGDRGALDAALAARRPDVSGWRATAKCSFDYSRRLGSILVTGPSGALLIVKGAPEAVLPLCGSARLPAGVAPFGPQEHAAVLKQMRALAQDGLRSIAVASKPAEPAQDKIAPTDESDLVFEGLCAFADPPKESAAAAIAGLAAAGVKLRVLSGDDPVVVQHLAGLVGLRAETVLSGADVAKLGDDALAVRVRQVDAYGRLTPDQKSRLIKALQASGEVVGYLGDGINDAPALKAAHIGLSVAGASGVAQAAADMILLESHLEVVADGVGEGRRTFANILKYVRMGASSNFGNMLSMAAASLFLPFLPMAPTQILLNNLLYDVSEIGIPFDTVRPEAVARPQVWDMHALIRFAAVMGPLSSVFDLLTFGLLLTAFHVSVPQFQTAWFLESMATQILVIFIIRTNGRPWRDAPRPLLTASTLCALAVAMAAPFTPIGKWFGFQPPPLEVGLGLGFLVGIYLASAELLKRYAVGSIRQQVSKSSAMRTTV